MPKTIHLSCGHTLSVRSWPSQAGMKAVRHHYKVHHPSRMKRMTKKSLRTKRKRGLINPFDLKAGISKLRSEYSKLSTFPVSHHSKFRMILSKADDETVKILANAKIKFVSVMARNEMFRRGLTNPCKRRNAKLIPRSERWKKFQKSRRGKGYYVSYGKAGSLYKPTPKKNPQKRWYVGSNKFTRKGEIFDSSFKPTKQSHGRFYLYVTGPFATIEQAQKYKRDMDLA